MENKKTILVVTLVLAITLFFGCTSQTSNPNNSNNGGLNGTADVSGNNGPQTATVDPNQMVDCSNKMDDPMCFLGRMNQCLPVTTKMTGTGDISIDITVLGIENETCHFVRKLNNVLDLNCYFPRGTLNKDTLDQMFGNDKGLQSVVDDACKYPTGSSGW